MLISMRGFNYIKLAYLFLAGKRAFSYLCGGIPRSDVKLYTLVIFVKNHGQKLIKQLHKLKDNLWYRFRHCQDRNKQNQVKIAELQDWRPSATPLDLAYIRGHFGQEGQS